MGVARGGGEPPVLRNHREQAEGKGLSVPGAAHVISCHPHRHAGRMGLRPHFTEEKMEAEGADGTCPGSYRESRADT